MTTKPSLFYLIAIFISLLLFSCLKQTNLLNSNELKYDGSDKTLTSIVKDLNNSKYKSLLLTKLENSENLDWDNALKTFQSFNDTTFTLIVPLQLGDPNRNLLVVYYNKDHLRGEPTVLNFDIDYIKNVDTIYKYKVGEIFQTFANSKKISIPELSDQQPLLRRFYAKVLTNKTRLINRKQAERKSASLLYPSCEVNVGFFFTLQLNGQYFDAASFNAQICQNIYLAAQMEGFEVEAKWFGGDGLKILCDLNGIGPLSNPAFYERNRMILTMQTPATYFETAYVEGSCYGTGGGGTGGDGGTDGGGGGGTGGGPSAEDPNQPLAVDCDSFDFRHTTIANWQEAGVKDIRLKWVWISGNNSGVTREVYVPQVVFGLPQQYQNANGSTTTQTPGQAANKAAALTDLAKLATYREFRDSPYMPDDASVQRYFIQVLAGIMASERGTAGTNGSGSPAIVFRTEDRSNFSDPHDCI